MAPEQMAEPPEAGPSVPPARPLDAIDQDILHMLQADGRASIRSVAERVHVSRANAYARINRLIEDGTFEVHVAKSFPLDRAAEAQRAADEHHLGKVALRPN